MYSLTKTAVPPEAIHEIVKQHLGKGANLRAYQELHEGYFNSAYQIELQDGLRCILKVAPADAVRLLRYEKDIMHAEVEAIRLVRAQAQVPAPEVYAFDTSRSILDNDFCLLEYLSGTPYNKIRPSLLPEEQAEIDRQAGWLTRQINRIQGERFGYLAQAAMARPTWRETFSAMLKGVLVDGEDMNIPLPLPYQELERRVSQKYFALDEITTPCLVHWDLWDGNIFVDPETKRITGLIDFERALWGYALMECNFGFMPPDSQYMQGYGGGMLDREAQRSRRWLYNVYLYLIMVIECTYRQFETHDQENWARLRLEAELENYEG